MERFDGIGQRVRTGALVALLFAAPMLVGGVHAVTAWVLSVSAVLLLAAMVTHTQARGRRLEIPWMGGLLLALTVGTALQLLPLPAALLRLLAPQTHDLYAFVLADAGPAVREVWRCVSLDRAATALEVCKLAGLSALVVALANTHRRSSSREQLTLWVAVAGGAVALVALLGLALGTQDYLGLYSPRGGWDPLVAHGPFVNPNHLAGLMGMCAMAAFGLAGSAQQPRGRGVFAGCLGGVCLAALVLSGSRGAVVAAVATTPLLLLMVLRARRGQGAGRLALGALLVIVVASGFAFGRMGTALRAAGDPAALREDRKLRAFAGVLTHVRANPLVGTGRGAFARAHTRYKTLPDNVRFTHAENEALQAVADWGLPLGLLAVGGGLLFVVALLRRRELSPLQAGQTCGLVFLGLHNMVDFNIETLGVAVPAAVVLGMLASPPRRRAVGHGRGKGSGRGSRRRRRPDPGGLRRARSWALPGGLGLAALAGLPLLTAGSPDAALAALRDHVASPELDAGAFAQDLDLALDRAPAEYLTPLLAARALAPRGAPRPAVEPARVLRWINRAMYLNPTAPGPHLLAARLLWATGHRRQALGEYRLAGRRGAPPMPLARELMAAGVGVEPLLRTLPATGPALRALATELMGTRRWREADRVLAQLQELPTWRPLAVRQRTRIALDHGTPEQALAHARTLCALRPGEGEPFWLLGRALQRSGDDEQAFVAWERATTAAPRLDRAWSARLAGLARRGAWLEVAELLPSFEPHSRHSPRARVSYLVWKARLEARHGQVDRATENYREALRSDPGAVRPAMELAGLLERHGDRVGAAAALQMALDRGGPASLGERIERLRAGGTGTGTGPP